MAKRRNTSEQQPSRNRRQAARARRESRVQRAVIISTIVVVVAVVGLVSFAIINEQVLKPNRAVVEIGNEQVSVQEFQDTVLFDLFLQTGGQPIQDPNTFDPIQFGQTVLDGLINDAIITQKATEAGIEVTDAEILEEIQLSYGFDEGDPEPTSTPFPTPANTLEPTLTATFVATLTATPTLTLEPGVTPTATATSTPEPTATPEDMGTATPTVTPTPFPTAEPPTEEDFQDNYANLLEQVSLGTGLSTERVEELFYADIRSNMLRQELLEELDITADDTKVRINAAHILVATEEEALAVLERIDAGELFEELAAELSLDTSNAYKGGDLGWSDTGSFVPEFEEAAYALNPEEFSAPVESPFGWHIIKLHDKQEAATLSFEQDRQRLTLFDEQLAKWREEMGIDPGTDWLNFMPNLF